MKENGSFFTDENFLRAKEACCMPSEENTRFFNRFYPELSRKISKEFKIGKDVDGDDDRYKIMRKSEEQSIGSFVFDTLREWDPVKFPNYFQFISMLMFTRGCRVPVSRTTQQQKNRLRSVFYRLLEDKSLSDGIHQMDLADQIRLIFPDESKKSRNALYYSLLGELSLNVGVGSSGEGEGIELQDTIADDNRHEDFDLSQDLIPELEYYDNLLDSCHFQDRTLPKIALYLTVELMIKYYRFTTFDDFIALAKTYRCISDKIPEIQRIYDENFMKSGGTGFGKISTLFPSKKEQAMMLGIPSISYHQTIELFNERIRSKGQG